MSEVLTKGRHGQECNKTACDNSPAMFYNQSTKLYYCASCAVKINLMNRADAMRLFNSDLCLYTSKPEFKEQWCRLSDKDQYFTAYAHAQLINEKPHDDDVDFLRRLFNLGNPHIFVSEDRMRFRIAAESVDIMKVLIKNYIKQ